MTKRINLIFIFSVLLFILIPVFALSQEIEYPEVPEVPKPTPVTTFPEYVKYLFNLAIISGGIIALAVIIWAGFLYFSSATSGEKKAEAKKKIISAFLGLIILLSAYLILATINPQLTILSLQPVSPPATTSSPTPATPTTTFQEIPLGTLTENILAKNISCFDKDRNLIDCQESQCFSTTSGYICKDGMRIQDNAVDSFRSLYPAIATSDLIFVPGTDFRYCYEYDSNGNKKGLLEYKDQYECIRNLLPALKVKSEKLRDLVRELKTLSNQLKNLSEELKNLSEELKNLSGELKNYAHNCNCARCSLGLEYSGCGSCDCPCDTCSPCNCDSATDPCPDRQHMETLRNTTLPNKISEITCTLPTCIIPKILAKEEEVHKKRDEIRGFIFGAATSTDWWYYATSMDPYATSTFLTFDDGRARLESFLTELLYKDFNDLKKAEDLMKSPYGDRLTLMEFLDIKEKDPRIVNTQKFQNEHFKVYEIDKYCYDFNCTGTTTEGICDKCATSTEGRMCRIKVEAGTSSELYVFPGDPATFYYQEEYKEEKVLTKEKCIIESKKKEGFAIGLIPIGETVDETEDFAASTIAQLQNFYNEVKSIQDKALEAREEARLQIVAVQNQIEKITGDIYQTDIPVATTSPHLTLSATTSPYQIYYVRADNQLIDLTSGGVDVTDDCLSTCSTAASASVCTAGCVTRGGSCCEDCDCDDPPCGCCKYTIYCTCQDCEGTPYPKDAIDTAYNNMFSYYEAALGFYNDGVTHYNNIVSSHNSIVTSLGKLPGYFNKFTYLIEAKNLASGDPNRCTILHKLTNSRKKLTECITGYGFALKKGKVKKRVFSSKIGLDLDYSGRLVILPDFPYPGPSPTCLITKDCVLNAYPYNNPKFTPSQKHQCYKNKDSQECWGYIKDLLENYYCCQKTL